MRFHEALGHAMDRGAKVTRFSWGDFRKVVFYNAVQDRIRYKTPYRIDTARQLEWNYYPTQEDILATDWEVVG